VHFGEVNLDWHRINPPTAWIFSQFAAANMGVSIPSTVAVLRLTTADSVVRPGVLQPDNLVLSGAFSLTFLTYTSSLILPFLAAAVVTYPFLVFFLFRSAELIPSSIELPTDDAEGITLTTGAVLVTNKARYSAASY